VINFYRASYYPAVYAVKTVILCLSVCLCLYVSDTSRYSTKTAKWKITQTTPHDSLASQMTPKILLKFERERDHSHWGRQMQVKVGEFQQKNFSPVISLEWVKISILLVSINVDMIENIPVWIVFRLRDLLHFWQINVNISTVVQERDMVAMEDLIDLPIKRTTDSDLEWP